MRYPLEGRKTVERLTKGSGILAGVAGLAKALRKRSLLPAAVPLAVGWGLLALGRTLGDAYVEIEDGQLHVKLGAFFDETIPLTAVERVAGSTWSLWGGLGVRSNLKDMVAVTTKSGPVAEITFKEPHSLAVLPKIWRIDAKRLVVSPENLSEFIEELRDGIDQDEEDD
ncbi:MAG: hypothetical protein JRI68_22365 [Deltaproteobacteria bacterium]|nr:hypothetical protein [Deltaproteobacteria bacterium]